MMTNNERDKIVNENLGLVHSCAKRFKGRGIEYDDLFQAGCIGLVKAIDNFDSSRGLKLSTYAVPVILGEIKRLFRDNNPIKVGRTLKELSLRVTREVSRFLSEKGREPTINELSEILSVSPETISDALDISVQPLSLTVYNDDGESQIDIPIEAPDIKTTELFALRQVLNQLPDIDRSIISLRFFKNKTQSQTASELGMTQVQISRREKKILLSLREKLLA